jgi:signal transduction histidine kinase
MTPVTDALGVTLEFELTPQLPSLRADELHLHRAIQEAVTNAIQYTPEYGKVTLRTFEQDGNGVLEVQDTGLGIPSELMPHLFEPFNHLSLPRNGFEKLGLGLPIAKKIIDKHGGSIDVISRPGNGSTITIVIPLYLP